MIKTAYSLYFGCKIGDQDNNWAHGAILFVWSRKSMSKKKKKWSIKNQNIPSIIHPVPQGSDQPIPVAQESCNTDDSTEEEEGAYGPEPSTSNDPDIAQSTSTKQHLITQVNLTILSEM
jgi:hypothetical protein